MSSLPPPPGAPPPPDPTPQAGSYWGSPEVGVPQPPPPGAPPAWAPAPGMTGAAHRPGALPLRPLGLGDIYDSAFRIIRHNAGATVGSAVGVAAVAMLIPVVVTAVITFSVGVTYDPGSGSSSDSDAAGTIASFAALVLGGFLQTIALVLVTGMVAQVTAAAAVGRRLTLGEAWAGTAGSRWRLLGLAGLLALIEVLALAAYAVAWVGVVLTGSVAVIVLWALISVPLFVVAALWFWVRVVYLAAPPVVLERIGIFAALERAGRLSKGQFWRILGIGLLTWLVTQIAGSIIGFPVGLVGGIVSVLVGPDQALLTLVLTQALAQVVSTAFVAPFTAAVTSLMYLDQRMRKEAYDVELMAQAGVLDR